MANPKPVDPTPPPEGRRVAPGSREGWKTDLANLEFARFVASVVEEQRGRDVVILDVGGELGITDYFVIGTASSERHAWALANEVESRVKRERERLKHHLEGQRGARWVLLDFGAVVLHLFCADTREYYDLEFLWGHVPRVALVEGGEAPSPPLAGDAGDPEGGVDEPAEEPDDGPDEELDDLGDEEE